ncbi:MAG: electron transfer flavoprotein subunit alpha/FixB family protein [Chloroflexota bacterium]|nr:electron transfer flavoprotein subunit alpha/FixB family protein [Chloroflexota bacterium]MDE2885386.1 electron transfer flavoprotein subunit alpha/FixB family protein [Chloroflexota bacterium]
MANALIIGEVVDSAPASATLECIAAARGLGVDQVTALLPGAQAMTAADTAIAAGADVVYTVVDGPAATGEFDALVDAAQAAAEQSGARYVIGAKTLTGRDVMPRLAFRLGTALASDCSAVALDASERLIATRPVYGGNAEASIACLGTPAVASLRPKSVDALAPDASRSGEVQPLAFEPNVRTRVLERAEETGEGVRLENARVVVSGGRGLGGPEPFDALRELAGLLGGAVGASRAACDAGWVPSGYQVGLTGKTVTPDLYIAVGISGASQHMAGCSNSRTLVAINKDAGANIFKEARFGVAGDWQKVLPAFMEQLHELLG